MMAPADPVDAPAPGAQPPPSGESQSQDGAPPPAEPQVDESRVHLYEAVSIQRDKVLNSFDAQRAAILKAVADQRAAAMAPILAVQARRHAVPGADPSLSGVPPGAAGPSDRPPPVVGRRQAVAAEVVAALRIMIAAEVRAQLVAMLQAATRPQDGTRSASNDRSSDPELASTIS